MVLEVFDDGFVGNRGRSHGVFKESSEEKSPGTGRSAIEPEHEFVQVGLQMLMRDTPLMRPAQPAFEKSDDAMRQLEIFAGRFMFEGLGPGIARPATKRRETRCGGGSWCPERSCLP